MSPPQHDSIWLQRTNKWSPTAITTLNKLLPKAIKRIVFLSKVSKMAPKPKFTQQHKVLIHWTTILDTQSIQTQLELMLFELNLQHGV